MITLTQYLDNQFAFFENLLSSKNLKTKVYAFLKTMQFLIQFL